MTVADVNVDKGEAVAAELDAQFVPCDVREEDQVQAAVARAAEGDGGLRVAVCCAGTGWAHWIDREIGHRSPHRPPLLLA